MGDMRTYRSILFAVGLGWFSFGVVLTGMAGADDFYFHGMTDDQAQKVASGQNGAPPPAGNLTFDSNGPNAGNATPIQQVMGNPNSEFIPNQLAVWWVGPFSGTIDGNIQIDWTWQTSNEDGALQGINVVFKVVADPDFSNPGVGTQNVIGADSAMWQFTGVNTPKTFTTIIGVHGTVVSSLLIQVGTRFVNTGPGLTALYDHPDAPSRWSLPVDPNATGACCDPTSGTCSIQTGSACAAMGGIFHGANTTCAPNPCSIVTPCVLPGVVVVVDSPGASDVPPVTDPQQDLQSVAFAEPYGDPLGDVLVITMKVASLNSASLPPNAFWRTTFTTPDAVQHYVSMLNCATGGVSYECGHFDGVGSVGDGPPDAGTYSADGTIQITVTKDRFENMDPGGTITGINADTRDIAGDCPPTAAAFAAIDVSASGTYTLAGNDYCKPPTVSCPASFSGMPGDYPLSFTVNNPSTAWRTFSVSISDPEGWVVGGPISDVVLGPVAPGGSASLPVVVHTAEECSPAVIDPLGWTATALDLPAPTNVAACQTTATCFTPDAGVGDAVGSFSFELLGSNPFRGEGRFGYTLAEPSRVKVEVFGIRGERLRTLVDRVQGAGSYTVSLKLHEGGADRALGAGVYLVRITAGKEMRSLRAVGLD
jgi:hypothetical protein